MSTVTTIHSEAVTMMPIPREYAIAYYASNAVAVAILVVAWRRPTIARWICVAVFLCASITNATISIRHPASYLEYSGLTVWSLYRDFINGWFSQHVRWVVLPIALGQLVISILLSISRPWRSLGVVGAVTFLLAIAPLGAGSAFPLSVTFSAALIMMNRSTAGVA
jgi:hypothetical protein